MMIITMAAISGNTDSEGFFAFTFGAEEASGEHKITAICDDCTNKEAYAKVDVEVEGLVQLADDKVTSTDFVTRGGLPAHRDNHYFEFDSFKQILKLGMTFNIKYKQRLLVNDSSLKQGGLYDISGGWRPSHFNHREGIVVDINNFKERNI